MFAFTGVGVALGLYDARRLGFHMTFQDYGTLVGPLQFFLLFRTIRLVLWNPAWRLKGLRALLLSSAPVSILAILQQANVPKVRSFVFTMTGSDVLTGNGSGYRSFARATGPFPHWTPLAGYLTVVLVVGLATVLEPGFAPFRSRRLHALLLLDAVALMLTAELSAIFGLAVAIILLGAFWGQLGRLMRAAGVAVAALAIVTGPYLASRVHNEYSKISGTNRSAVIPQTIEFRLHIWKHQYFPAIAQRPVNGYGMATPTMIVWPATESQYVTVLERGGAVLMTVYIALMVGLATAGLAVARRSDNPVSRVTGYSVTTLVIILVPMNAVFPYFEDSGLPQALWALVGIMLAGVPGRLPPVGLVASRRRGQATAINDFTSPPSRS
ncbi:MAG: O-antigen ligase family protein [Acidimicrobiales bacterium]